MTIAIDGEPELWAPRGTFLASSETRCALPQQFMRWYQGEQLKVASRWARWLGLTTGPRPISTALWLAVRLSLRGTELRRRWISFSVIEEPALRGLRLPDAEIEPELVDGTVRFSFSETEPPLATATSLRLVACEERSAPHCYARRDAVSRQITLARDK